MPSDSAAPHGGADRSYLDTALRAISVTGSLRSFSQQSTPSRSEPVAEMVANNSQARIKNEPDPHYGSGSFFCFLTSGRTCELGAGTRAMVGGVLTTALTLAATLVHGRLL